MGPSPCSAINTVGGSEVPELSNALASPIPNVTWRGTALATQKFTVFISQLGLIIQVDLVPWSYALPRRHIRK